MEGIKLATKLVTVGFVALLATACAVPDDDPLEGFAWRSGDDGGVIIEPPGGEDPLAGSEDGGGGMGGDWIVNGLSDPHVSGVKVAYPLDSPEGLGAEGWLVEGDPEGEKVIRYLVECALGEADSITVVGATNTWVFWGDVGLAPEWENNPCDATCQQWVSACLLARVNPNGDVKIFVQGAHPNLGYGSDPEYPNFEGTFFGNIFAADPAPMHACRGSSLGTAAATEQGRNCTLGEEHCGFTTYSSCDVAAGCDLGVTGLPTVDCEPVAGGPIFQGIAVHVRTP